jgi:ribosomal protein S3
LLGYKFEFKGRFTRKQRAANLWYLRGANPLSSMDQNVEIGVRKMILKYGACCVKVWLYKGKMLPTYSMRFD